MISPRAKALFDQYRLMAAAPQAFDLQAIRAVCEGAEEGTGIPADVQFDRDSVAGVPVIRCTPPKISARFTVIYLHGGAHCLMSAQTHARMAGHLALACGAEVLVPDYRLAPEHPFPAGLNDALAVVRAQNGAVALVGDSSGGGLTAGCLLTLRGTPQQPFCGVLMSPWLDLTLGLPSIEGNGKLDLMLRAENLRAFAGLYLGDTPSNHPVASPLHADLHDLPPLLVQAAEHDILCDDALEFAAKLKAVGGAVECQLWPEMQHSFQFFAGRIPEADAAILHAGEFIAANAPLLRRGN